MNETIGRIRHVEDIKEDQLCVTEYDFVIFACGSEPRCVNIAEKLNASPAVMSNAVVLCIKNATDERFQQNKLAFENLGYRSFSYIDIEGTKEFYRLLNEKMDVLVARIAKNGRLRVFVDYSSMPRDWYAALLNWACSCFPGDLVIDFGYSMGQYKNEWEPKRCIRIRNIGDAGSVSNNSNVDDETVVIGLGLDADAPYTVQSSLDLKEAIAFITGPSVTQDIDKKVREINRNFIEEYCSACPLLIFPVGAVAEVYQCLSEIAAVKHLSSTVVLVPLGPKPHVLASILTMHKYNNTVCIKVDHKHERRYAVEAGEETVFTRVTINRNDM